MNTEEKKLFKPNAYEQSIFDVYANLGIGVTEENGVWKCKRQICNECRSEDCNLKKPSSLWQVGDHYFESKYKLLLVGKAARGNPGGACSLSDGSVILDTTGKGEEKDEWHGFECLKNMSWAYWRYSRELLQRLYGEEGWEYVAFTNMVKCNSSDDQDTTTTLRKNNCVEVIKSEIEYLKPKNIVFYTHYYYDTQISAIFDKSETLETDNSTKRMPLWRFTGELNGHKINGIRVAHPQGKNKEKFLKAIIDRLTE